MATRTTCHISGCDRPHAAANKCAEHLEELRLARVSERSCATCNRVVDAAEFEDDEYSFLGRNAVCKTCAPKVAEYHEFESCLSCGERKPRVEFSIGVVLNQCDDCARKRYQDLLVTVDLLDEAVRRTYEIRAEQSREATAESLREMDRLKSARRRAQIRECKINDFTVQDWRELLDEWNHSCRYCGDDSRPELLQVEHRIPLGGGHKGDHTKSNIVPACPRCNYRKHTKTDVQFLAQLALERSSTPAPIMSM